MQRQSMFEGNWELKWSAGVTTALVAFMLISCVGGMWDYRDEVGGIAQMILGIAFLMSPMLIGLVLNWIGTVRKNRPLLFIAGTFYVLNGLFDLAFLLYNAVPAILVFRAFYKLGKKQLPKAPRLR
ncbi:MAG TPA: hypothetical protein IAC59_04115 [Candidatus Fimadaptatus faecigallinarum]|uniref:Lipoprotein n=1 Tax=Candidatus Fimadaptatus faecigallinarum TaxID=2840814 RepID=A0A9D1LR33_9FIRM|nr:hypothetical protein [Candidatus Fimadaptatus faecigallinarum]